jgi:hypothetical protein
MCWSLATHHTFAVDSKLFFVGFVKLVPEKTGKNDIWAQAGNAVKYLELKDAKV